MLFESLDKLKRNSIMSAILLMTLGAIILICPQAYVGLLALVGGYTLVVVSIVMILNFLSGNKSLMEYMKFCCALIVGFVGMSVLVFRGDIMRALAWIFGLLLLLDGGRTLFHSFTYARRSQRKGWWVLAILSVLLMVTGIIVFLNPYWDTPAMLMKVIGCAIFFSSIVNAVRLIWTWPLKNGEVETEEGGSENGQA
ncbi:MAG: DUF308 domain-containing protein [Oscillospiraceae bacterium]|nr:DUF308 domain-containing protein [Oscillospiraceae bacterium]